MPAAGTLLGPYRIAAQIGAGGWARSIARATRACRATSRSRCCRRSSPPTPSACAASEQEARAAGALSHPNVCTIFDIGTHEGAPYVVMELLEGGSLRERLKDGALPWRKAADYAAQAATGLAAAHGKGIVHRDLKPRTCSSPGTGG